MENTLTIRRYSVPFYHVNSSTYNFQLTLCGSEIIQDNVTISFRWLQTVVSILRSGVDDIFLDNVQISIYTHPRPLQHLLLQDNFDSDNQIRLLATCMTVLYIT